MSCDPSYGDVALLLAMNGANGSTVFVDSSPNAFTITTSGASQSNTPTPEFDSTSGAFGGGAYVSAPITVGGPLDLQDGADFTIEAWIYPTAISGQGLILSDWSNFPGSELVKFFVNGVSAGVMQLQGAGAGAAGGIATTSASVTVNTWQFVTAVKQGSQIGVFINGVAGPPSSWGAFTGANPQTTMYCGTDSQFPVQGNAFSGSIQQLRVTKGLARYTPGVDFIPPDATFPAIPCTTVPDVVGETLSQGSTDIVTAGFIVGTVAGQASATIPVGLISDQSPEGGTPYTAGLPINLFISTGPSAIHVPNVVGLTQSDAQSLLASDLLVAQGITFEPSATVPAGIVISQGVAPGTLVTAGTTVPIVVSTGEPVTNPFDVDITVISQYANSSTILQLIKNMAQYMRQDVNFQNFYNFVWNVNTAQGFGLNIWGRIVDISRLLEIPNNLNLFGFENSQVPPGVQPFNFGVFNVPGGEVSQSYLLPDDAYRTLILVKALANISRTDAPSINRLLQNLFPNRGKAYVIDLGGMAMQFTFEFQLTITEYAILSQSGALPHPAGVRVAIVTVPAGVDLFGFAEAPGSDTFGFGVFYLPGI